MADKLVSLIVLTYNSRRHLEALLRSIREQTYSAIELIVVDNASQDDTVSFLQSQTIRIVDQLIVNPQNYWFAKGNNIGITASHGDYIYICNDDIQLSPACIARLVAALDQDKQRAMVGPKVLKLVDGRLTTMIDSTGLLQHRSGKTINRGENTVDRGQFNTGERVFGITGAAMLIRRSALERAKFEQEYFDEDFVAYKEDIDLSWRLQHLGYDIYYEPSAIVYHARTQQKQTMQTRRHARKIIRAYSYRNHLWTLVKNLTGGDFLRRAIWLIPYECAKLVFVLLCEWTTLTIIPQCIRGFGRMRRKRHYYATL